jgi:hypothetical protein
MTRNQDYWRDVFITAGLTANSGTEFNKNGQNFAVGMAGVDGPAALAGVMSLYLDPPDQSEGNDQRIAALYLTGGPGEPGSFRVAAPGPDGGATFRNPLDAVLHLTRQLVAWMEIQYSDDDGPTVLEKLIWSLGGDYPPADPNVVNVSVTPPEVPAAVQVNLNVMLGDFKTADLVAFVKEFRRGLAEPEAE